MTNDVLYVELRNACRPDDANGQLHAPVLVGVNGVPGPGSIAADRTCDGLVAFEISGEQPPHRLVWDVRDYIFVPRRGETIEWIFSSDESVGLR